MFRYWNNSIKTTYVLYNFKNRVFIKRNEWLIVQQKSNNNKMNFSIKSIFFNVFFYSNKKLHLKTELVLIVIYSGNL